MKNVEGIDKELEETLKVFQAKVFGLLITDRASAKDYRKVRALAIGDIKKSIQSYYENLLPSEKEMEKIARKLGFVDMTGKYYCFTGKQIKDRPSICDLAKSIRSEMLSKIKGV